MKKAKIGVLIMLTVINRYKALFIILMLAVLAALLWLFISMTGNSKLPSKGVFVLNYFERTICNERGSI